jgi:hypothetical protein
MKSSIGTHYHQDTTKEVISILDASIRRQDRVNRLRLVYGDTKTGKSWEEIYDVSGYISRSMGPVQVPILLNNIRSHGGGAILDHCIIAIRYANRKTGNGYLYRHPLYKGNE